MSYPPNRLLELRDYLKPQTGLSDNEIGIVGDVNHNGGYHCGWDRRRIVNGVLKDYSWTESTRDSGHKTDAASAIDIGMFARLVELSLWLVDECKAGAPDTADIRSIIYSPDGQVVKRWDRLGLHVGGDSSHTSHTHVSFHRDAEDRDKTAVFRRFFEGDEHMADEAYELLNKLTRKEGSATYTPAGPDGERYGSLSNALAIEPAQKAAVDARLAADRAEEILATLKTGGVPPAELEAAFKAAIMDPQVLSAIAKAVTDEIGS